jgi:predicted nucleic acid-binding protein
VGVIVDTSIWVDVERGALSPAEVGAVTGREPVFLSPVTIAELTHGVEISADPATRQRRLAAVNRLRRKPCLRIDEDTGAIFGSVSAHLQKAGKAVRFRVQDLWIASQAIQQGYALLTANAHDFSDVPGLQILEMPRRPAPRS